MSDSEQPSPCRHRHLPAGRAGQPLVQALRRAGLPGPDGAVPCAGGLGERPGGAPSPAVLLMARGACIAKLSGMSGVLHAVIAAACGSDAQAASAVVAARCTWLQPPSILTPVCVSARAERVCRARGLARCMAASVTCVPAGHHRVRGPGSPAARAPRTAAGELPLRHQWPGTRHTSLHLVELLRTKQRSRRLLLT